MTGALRKDKTNMFGRKRQQMMVFVIEGFLEAGKTSLIRDLLVEDLYDGKSKTLILCCEEGEEEYEPAFLAKAGAVVEMIEDEESFNGKVVEKFLKKHRPDRIVIEYNGMWRATRILEMYTALQDICFDRDVIFQTIGVANDETFSLYMKNMPSLMVEHFKIVEMMIVNRCTIQTSKSAIRGSIKAVNPRVQIVYESEDDAFYDLKEELPFDVNADVIDIADDDFGMWYVDMMDQEDAYEGKTLKLTGMVQKPKGLEPGFVVFGRYAMTCCADDVQFIGFLCKADDWEGIDNKDYVNITARLEFKYRKEYGEKGPVFYAEEVTKVDKPKEELVYFN